MVLTFCSRDSGGVINCRFCTTSPPTSPSPVRLAYTHPLSHSFPPFHNYFLAPIKFRIVRIRDEFVRTVDSFICHASVTVAPLLSLPQSLNARFLIIIGHRKSMVG